MRGQSKRRGTILKWLLLVCSITVFLFLIITYHGIEWALAKISPTLFKKVSMYSQHKLEKEDMALEIDFLKKKSAELELENSVLKEELKTLQEGVELSKSWSNFPHIKSVVARIILKDASGLSTSFIIDAGSADGIRKDMPVMGREAVIGRIVDVHQNFSRVRTIQSSKIAFGSIIRRSRETGVVIGGSKGLTMHYLSINADVKIGDDVITSGTTDITPPGLYIGKVKEVVMREKDEELEIHIESPENIKALNFVRVVLTRMSIPEGGQVKGSDNS